MDDNLKITLAVAGKFQAYSLASEYARMGVLADIYSAHRSLSPPKSVPRDAFHNRIDLALWTKLARYLPGQLSVYKKNRIFDSWVSSRLKQKTPGVLHGWNGCSINTFKLLKDSGWLLCVERSCPHNMFQYELLKEEGERLNVPHIEDMRELEKNIEELYLADVVVAPSNYSAGSYNDEELVRKVRINHLGSNVPYQERTEKKDKSLVVLMVGNSFLRKGTHYLIEAFKYIDDPRASLLIRGDVPHSYRERIKDPRIKIIPPVTFDQLKILYQSADVFVQPSIDEGFGMTVFEALGHGVPLVVTENVGCKDLLSPDVAEIVPIRDPYAIAAAIERARRLPGDEFDAARKQILEKNTWSACAKRMVDEVYVH